MCWNQECKYKLFLTGSCQYFVTAKKSLTDIKNKVLQSSGTIAPTNADHLVLSTVGQFVESIITSTVFKDDMIDFMWGLEN